MTRAELEHIIRAATAILGEEAVIVIGSQSILGRHPSGLPAEATESMEADILPQHDPDGRKADLIDGTLGEASMFEDRFGIYAQGVGRDTARLPQGWESRLVPVRGENTNGLAGLCLDPHDLLVSKYLAGRPKDIRFCAAIVAAGLVDEDLLAQRLRQTACSADDAVRVLARIRQDFGTPTT